MRLECEHCRELVEVGSFWSSAEGIEIACPACESRFFVPAGGAGGAGAGGAGARDPHEPGPGRMRCPKCDELQPEAAACRRCGLVASRFETFAARASAEVPEELARAWQRVCDAWDDPAAHDAFAERAAAAGAFAYAAGRYRRAARERPGDAVAARRFERVRRMAEAALLAPAAGGRGGEDEPEPYRNVVWLLFAMLILAGAGGTYALLQGGGGPPARRGEVGAPPVRPPPVTSSPPSRRPAPAAPAADDAGPPEADGAR